MSLRKTFVAGLFLVMPLVVTWFLLSFLVDKVDQSVTPVLTRMLAFLGRWVPLLDPGQPWVRPLVPVAGFVIVFAVILAAGLMGSHYIGKRIIGLAEQQILRLPFIRSIYGSAKQVFEAFSLQSSGIFDRVVLVEYPRLGLYTIAFVTRRAPEHVRLKIGRDDLTYIFVPTTPNPTSGFLLLVPESDLIDAQIGVEDAVKTIISGGMVTAPPRLPAPPPPGIEPAVVERGGVA